MMTKKRNQMRNATPKPPLDLITTGPCRSAGSFGQETDSPREGFPISTQMKRRMKVTRNYFYVPLNASLRVLAFTLLTLLATAAHGAVTNVAWYRLGEDDARPVAGEPGLPLTIDVMRDKHLRRVGAPLYSSAVAPAP